MNFVGKAELGAWRVFTGCVGALCWPVLRVLAAGRGESASTWRERLGVLPAGVPRGGIWVHGASVGEMSALAPFLRKAARRAGRKGVVVSAMTPAGKRRARELLGFPAVNLPLDCGPWVRRALDRAAPRTVIVAETELWPVFVTEAARRAKLAWVNGRISDRSFPRYLMVRPLVREMLSKFDVLCVISGRDAERAVQLGAPSRRVRVTGNLKADLIVPASRPGGVPGGQWFVAGSTRPGEEEQVLAAFALVRKAHPRLRLCLAPRHLDRAGEVAALAQKSGFRVARRSSGPARARLADVLLLDTHGELASFYRLATAAFVGGTLVPIGGHNVMEPAAAGVPVLFGPHTGNVREEAAGLVRSGGGYRVADGRALAEALGRLVSSRTAEARAGARARGFLRSRQGVARRVVALLAREGLL